MRVYEKNGIKLGKGNLDRTTGSVVAVVIMHLAHIKSLSIAGLGGDHPLSDNQTSCILII
jgi:hypothetical protein